MSVSMAVTAFSPTSSSSSSSSSSSTSLPLCNKLPHLHSDYYPPSLTPTPITHFTSKTKPVKPLKLKAQFPHIPPFSLLLRSLTSRASAVFTEQPESEPEWEQEQEEEEEREEDGDDGEQTETESDDAGKLFVGNLPYSMTSSELGEIFGEAGRVNSVEIIYDRVTDRSRGFAFVTMGSVEDAKEAIRMFNGSQVGGRTVKVNFPEVPRRSEREVTRPRIRSFIDSPHKIYVGNLSKNITSKGLREAFADQPGLLSARVVYERDSGISRGYGFLSFSSAEEMVSALSAMRRGVELEGRTLWVNVARSWRDEL